MEAAQTMRDHKVGSVFVEDNGQYLGIITEGEIYQKVIEEIKKPIKVQASEIMSQPIITIEADLSTATAYLKMYEMVIRCIGVTENGRITGVLSIKDFGRYYIQNFKTK